MKALIIGYGSIGKRHYEILSSMQEIDAVDIVTSQELDDKKTFNSLEAVDVLQSYDYFLITSQTHKHYEQLAYLDLHVRGKILFCEKPLFDKDKELAIKNNKVYVGFDLRFYPLMLRLKKLLEGETVLSANASCGQYLPTWRPDRDYRNSYSAHKNQGGGVLLDLSHEIDYIQWLCGDFKEVKSYQKKVSDLEIDSDDFTTFIGITDKDVIATITIDYISKITHRVLHVNTLEQSFTLDFIAAKLIQRDKSGLEQIHTVANLEKNYFYTTMHRSIFNDEGLCCDYAQAKAVMQTIKMIQEQA